VIVIVIQPDLAERNDAILPQERGQLAGEVLWRARRLMRMNPYRCDEAVAARDLNGRAAVGQILANGKHRANPSLAGTLDDFCAIVVEGAIV
jgi:hypothetical protein